METQWVTVSVSVCESDRRGGRTRDGENHTKAYGVEPSAFNARDQFVWMVYMWFAEVG